ncbi:hypothetical protein [Aquabacterium sp. CECT 9606]|uniref:hypothetical protein n=1 Tax=Aquabacterium sp. CECT 9606 TaxID=2845822 RepID=UPI001E34A89A|nr:hypothetical protein [Aquabacterium sp. CECT 9606]CAH0351056.1 hypothetical protein AQB9606_01902 [Aquabacterium sp. CECT 9606]
MATTTLTRADYIGMGAIANARRDLLQQTFKGTQLKFGSTDKVAAAKKLMASAKKARSSSNKLAGPAKTTASSVSAIPGVEKAVKEFIVQCADLEGIEDVIEAITSAVLADIIAEIVPVVGVLVSGGKLAKAGKAVVEDGYNLYQCRNYKKGFLRGDPVAAAEAVQTLIQRDLARHSVQLAQQATATGAKIAGLFADMGTGTTAAIGLANALASLGLELFSLGLSIKDMRAGNRRLATPETLDLTVFEDCPILGCYLLTCADTSSVANFFVADIGLPGWMDKVEKMKKTQMDPLLKIARKNIASSRIQLEGLSQNKATHQSKGFFASIKRKAAKLV